MYILKAKITDLKSIRSLFWSVPSERASGWHVVLGDNGSGKSSVLKAIALALVGHENALALRLPLENWVRRGSTKAEANLHIQRDDYLDDLDSIGRIGRSRSLTFDFRIESIRYETDASHWRFSNKSSLVRSANGWFSAAYGPFRRFSGSDEQYEKISSEAFGLKPTREYREKATGWLAAVTP